jgi:hypothetical protein
MRFAAQRLKSTSRFGSGGFEASFCIAAACAFSKCHNANREEISPWSRAATQTVKSMTPTTSKHRSKMIDVIFALLKELPSDVSCVVSFSGKLFRTCNDQEQANQKLINSQLS